MITSSGICPRFVRAALVIACLALAGCARQQATLTSRSETAEKLSVEARQARERGDLQSARTLLTAAVERNPNDYETRLELSEMLLAARQAEAAAGHLQLLQDQNPDDPRVYVGLAEVRYLQHNLNEADGLLAQALDLDPRDARGLLLRAKIEQSRGNLDRALDDLYQVLDSEGEHVEARMFVARLHVQRGDSRLAASELRALMDDPSLNAEARSRAQWLLGRCYSQDGRWSEAAAALTAGISSRQGNSRDWCLLADACRRAGDSRGAEAAVENALALSPRNSQAIALRAALVADATAAAAPQAPAIARASHLEDESDADEPVRRN
ncbi:MAG: tetratricopeptide repeat protein [Planctomycetia bacterium]|nr:tetratricopeptide repeat protein [Planctomycetia bacterium]